VEVGILVKILGKYEFPEDLYYHPRHTWARIENGKVRVGIDDWGQQALGRAIAIRVLPVGRHVEQGKPLAVVESGKWRGTLYSPVSGKIIEVNEKLVKEKRVELLNEDPYGEGWIAVIEPTNLEEDLKNLIHGVENIEKWIKEDEEKLKKGELR